MKWKKFYSRFTYDKMLIKSKVIFLELYLSTVLIFKVIYRIFNKNIACGYFQMVRLGVCFSFFTVTVCTVQEHSPYLMLYIHHSNDILATEQFSICM